MKKKTKLTEKILPNKFKEKNNQVYTLAELCSIELNNLDRIDLKGNLQNIESYKFKKAKVYGDLLGTAKSVIETLESLFHVYYFFLVLDMAANNPRISTHLLISDYKGFADYSCLIEKSYCYQYILPSEELIISKINFNSPGFWEFIGEVNPLTQIREYINDRHKRKKDKQFWESELSKSILENQRIELENQKLALQNQEYTIELSFKKVALAKEIYSVLKDEGCSEIQLRNFTNQCVRVLSKLEPCIDNDRITEIEIEE